jgi:hypothetical protein
VVFGGCQTEFAAAVPAAPVAPLAAAIFFCCAQECRLAEEAVEWCNRRGHSLFMVRRRGGAPVNLSWQVRSMIAVKGIFMEKWLCFGSMGVAGLLLLLFLLDLILGYPFGGISNAVDIFGLLASGVLLYLSYDAYRDLR